TPLPAGTTATVDGDGKVSVTVPSDATPGTEYTIPVEVTYGDGSKEVVPVKVTVAAPDKDTTKPTIEAIGDQTVVEGKAITPITVKATDDSGKAPTVTVDGLPTGVTFDPTTGVISGTPTVADWGTDEEKPFTVTVTATDEAGNKTTETFDIKVQRDTDGDGMPDVTDPDDDNDGFSDEDEKTAKTDPKDPTSKPTTTIDGVSDKTVTEGQPIEPITVTTTNVPESGKTEVTGLPDGLTFDPETGKISGTPTKLTDWGKEEETREFKGKVEVKDKDGKVIAEKPFVITVQRDTDGDGMPDVTDTDDDNDGFTDEQEKTANTDPKDPNSKPTVTTDADKNDPKAKEQTVGLNETPKAEDSIENLKDLPAGTTVSFKDPVDTSTEGEKNATVVVTYPDGSSEEVPVKIVVKDKLTDADKNDPKAKE
ncbi:Rib/alpha-like domain-containing protein, partial [Streptococcus marmotae]